MTHGARERPYCLVVDSGMSDEPAPRYFGSLSAVWRAYDALAPEWRRFAEVRCRHAHHIGSYYPRIDRSGRVVVWP